MKLLEEVASVKLRGAYYTSPSLVAACLERIAALTDIQRPLTILEPSAGDGAFVRGLDAFADKTAFGQADITCVELSPVEAAKCRQEIANSRIAGRVSADSFFAWADQNDDRFDALVGNPPYVRYQFVDAQDRALAEWLLRSLGHDLHGVSNLWIPFVLLSLSRLREGGAFALVLPSELFTTMSGGQVRSELIRYCAELQIDLYPRDAFPDILQDVIIVSGVRSGEAQAQRVVVLREHDRRAVHTWQHTVTDTGESWTRYLLTGEEWEAFACARALSGFHALKAVAAIGVAIVTGANDFFTVDDATVERYGLQAWARPLLARTADSGGIVFKEADYQQARTQGRKAWLLDFSADKPDPLDDAPAAEYLRTGEAKKLPERYKCRIRAPWYRVPHIQAGTLMLPKRAHQHHRLLLNQPRVFTTDTIYRGEMTPAYAGREADIVASFHNSLTLLSIELEGRAYGGGVLELVPSEIGRLVVPVVAMRNYLERLDSISRAAGGQRDAGDILANATDGLLGRLLPAWAEYQPRLASARKRLRQRRFHGSDGAHTVQGDQDGLAD